MDATQAVPAYVHQQLEPLVKRIEALEHQVQEQHTDQKSRWDYFLEFVFGGGK